MDRRDIRKRVSERFFFDKFIPPVVAPTLETTTTTTSVASGTYLYAMTYSYAEGESDLSPIGTLTLSASGQGDLTALPAGDKDLLIHARNIYRTTAGGDRFFRAARIFDNDPTNSTFTDVMSDTTLATSVPFKTMVGDLTTEELNEYINKYNTEVAETSRCLIDSTTTSSVASQATYSIPTDAMLPFGRNVSIWFDNKQIPPITVQNLDDKHRRWRDTTSGASRFWYIEDSPTSEFLLWPPPDEADEVIRIRFPGLPTITNDASSMLDGNYTHKHDIIVDGVVAELHAKRGADAARGAFATYSEKLEKFRRELIDNKIVSDVNVTIPKIRLATEANHQTSDEFDRLTGSH